MDVGIKYIVTFDELCRFQSQLLLENRKKKQVAIYSCVVGGYDEIQDPISISDECDYYMITDEKKHSENVYTYIDINDVIPKTINDNTRKNRYCKINAHHIFPEYRFSIYFDGCARLKADIAREVNDLPVTRIKTLSKTDSSVYSLIYKNLIHGRDKSEILIEQGRKYLNSGFPETYVVFHPGVMVREHNNPICVKIMDSWWNEITEFSCRDMISFPYALWSNGFYESDVSTLISTTEVWNDNWGEWSSRHKKNRKMKICELPSI